MTAPPDYFTQPERIADTARARSLGRLAAYYRGTQYDGRPDWFTGVHQDGEEPAPLRERKPCIVYPLPKACCNQATRFTFGEGRFPTVKVESTEEEDTFAPELALSEEEAALITTYLGHVIKAAHLPSVMRTLLRHGLSQRTAVATIGLRGGQFAIDMPRAMDCAPVFTDDDPDGDISQMAWCYPFDKEVDRHGALFAEKHYFRRDFTSTEVTFYEDAPVEVGKPPSWRVDEARTAKARHGLGFAPVVWIRNLPEPHCAAIDGTALIDDLEDEIDALNFALSQRHRGIVYFGTPQAYETGVDEEERPAERGRVQRTPKDPRGGDGYSRPSAPGGAGARKTAPDQIWSYRSGEVKVGVMETTGIAFEVASKHVLDIRARILEAVDVVLLDPKEAAGRGEISGAALTRLYAPLLALVDELRDCWWSRGLARILSMILRITARLDGRGILIPNARKVAAICKRFFVQHEGGELWVAPQMTPLWGDYFSPSNAEIKLGVEAAVAAKDGGLVSAETATRYVGSYFGVEDFEDEVELSEGAQVADAEARLKRAEDAARASAPGAEPVAPSEPTAELDAADE